MCDPVTAGVVMGIASTASSIMQAQAASDAQDEAYEANRISAINAKADADRQINLQEGQNQEAAATEQLANNLQTQTLASRATVAGGEAGAISNNNAIVQNIERQGLAANTMIGQNLGRESAQLNEQRLGASSNMNSRINSVSQGAGVGMGTVLGAAAGGAQAGLGTASSLKILKA